MLRKHAANGNKIGHCNGKQNGNGAHNHHRNGRNGFAANGNGNSDGDFIYAKSASIQPSLPPVVSVLAASFAPGAASEAIASAFGANLATQVVIPSGDADPNTPGIQLPTSLAGTTVKVKDSLGAERLAPLFFVSPGQINYQIPTGIGVGPQSVVVSVNGIPSAPASLNITN